MKIIYTIAFLIIGILSSHAQITLILSSSNINCVGDDDGTASVCVSGGTLPYAYLWTNGATTASIDSLPPGTYTVNVNDSDTSSASGSVTISEFPQVIANAGSDSIICLGDSLVLGSSQTATGGISPYTYDWSPSTNLNNPNSANPVASPVTTTNYFLNVIDMNNCTSKDTILITIDSDCVWPGDANSDGISNNIDLLSLGLTYGSTGSNRPNASITWIGQQAADWIDTLSNGANYKHADCNGDGVVNSDDTLGISVNYNRVHAKTSSFQSGSILDPSIFLAIPSDSVFTGDTITAIINLGTVTLPAQNIYGLAFTLKYDQLLIDSNTIDITFTDSWIGKDTNSLSFTKDFFSLGEADAAYTRIDQKPISGSGKIGSCRFVIIDNVDGKKLVTKPLILSIKKITVIDSAGNEIAVNTISDTVIVKDPTGIKKINQLQDVIQVFPNPVSALLHISFYDLKVSKISLKNILGQTLISLENNIKNYLEIDVHEYDSGTYFIYMETDSGIIIRKVILR